MKYIIEIPDDVQYVLFNGKAENKYYTAVRPIAELEELNSDYINEHYGELQDTAYQRGLEDAWEAARRIIHMPEGDLLNIFTECYSAVCTALQVLLKYDAAEAIEKLKSYEDKQKDDDHIKVGDCVYDKEEQPRDDGVVTWVGKDTAYVMWRDGSSGERMKESLCKTGRTLNVKAILEAMRT